MTKITNLPWNFRRLNEIQGDIYPDLYWTSRCKRPVGSSGTPFTTGMCGNVALTLGHLSTYPANKNWCEHESSNILHGLVHEQLRWPIWQWGKIGIRTPYGGRIKSVLEAPWRLEWQMQCGIPSNAYDVCLHHLTTNCFKDIHGRLRSHSYCSVSGIPSWVMIKHQSPCCVSQSCTQ